MTKRIAISELEGAALDWAVLIAIGGELDEELSHSGMVFGTWDDLANSERFDPGSDWSQCGPLIERYRMEFREVGGLVLASPGFSSGFWGGDPIAGGSHCIAACRAIVASHNPSGYVEVPDELVEVE